MFYEAPFRIYSANNAALHASGAEGGVHQG